MKVSYSACSKSGDRTSGTIDASSLEDARQAIRAQGLFPTELASVAQATNTPTPNRVKNKPERVADFTRQLSLLLAAGTPLVAALSAVARQTKDAAWSAVIQSVTDDIHDGQPFSEALAQKPAIFDHVYVGMIQAGEAAGDLTGATTRLATITRQHVALNKALLSAVTYPALLVGVAMLTLVGMVMKVVPSFRNLFDSIGTPMPPSTQMMLALSDFLSGYWWAVLIAAAAAAAAATAYARTPDGRRAIDGLLINTPPFAHVIRSLILARVARVIGSAMESKVPLLEALDIARRATANTHYQEELASISHRVGEGQSISDVVKASPLITPSLAEAMGNGEQSGRLADVLLGVSDMMDEDNTTLVKSLTGILEPVILTVLGLVVGGIAMSLFLPLFDLTASAGGAP
ncbi:MAG: type II secretion system F family protein [Planctomycetota bacterium]